MDLGLCNGLEKENRMSRVQQEERELLGSMYDMLSLRGQCYIRGECQ